MSAAPPVAILVSSQGPAQGLAWTTTSAEGTELTVVGKLEFALAADGEARPLPADVPGQWQGRSSPDELAAVRGRHLYVRGGRRHPGRVVLRRGATSVAELELAAGADPATTQLGSASMSTVVGAPGDEWLVVEGFDAPGSRRWCKLPRVGLLASWQVGGATPERLLLGSRQIHVDVAAGRFVFVVRASRRLAQGAIPQRIEIAPTNLAPAIDVRPAGGDLGATLPIDGSTPAPVASPLPFAGAARPDLTAPGAARSASPLPFAAPRISPAAASLPPAAIQASHPQDPRLALGFAPTAHPPPPSSPPGALPRVGVGLPYLGEAPSEVTRTGITSTDVLLAEKLGAPTKPALPFERPTFDLPPELDETRGLDDAELPRESVLPFAGGPASSPPPAAPPVAPAPAVPAIVRAPAPATEVDATTLPVRGAPVPPGLAEAARESAPAEPAPVAVVAAPAPVVAQVTEEPSPQPSVRTELERRLRDGSPLTGLELEGADLSDLSLRHAKLAGLDLSLAKLSGADLSGADFTRAKLDGAKLDGAKLDGAILARASLEGADLSATSLRDVQARECVLVGATLDGADLAGADLRRAKLVGASLRGASGARLNGLESDWTGADFEGAKLDGANLRGAVLRRARLDGAQLAGADLRDADLREAMPASALEGAKLAGARRG